MPKSTYVIHATCRYVVQNKETKRTENGQYRPTLSIEATSREAAIKKATAQEKKRTATPHWPVVSFALIPELVNVIEHATAPQKKALKRLSESRPMRIDKGMMTRLLDKGWIEPEGSGWTLTPRGRAEATA